MTLKQKPAPGCRAAALVLMLGALPAATLPAATLLATTLPAMAQSAFPPPVTQTGSFRVAPTTPDQPIYPGSTVVLSGQGLVPGQAITLQRGPDSLTGDAPLTADAEGALAFEFTLPETAAVGMHPIVVLGSAPSTTDLLDLKISPRVPLSGAQEYDITSVKSPAPGLYQLAYSPSAGALFVTASSFRPMAAEILKLDPRTLGVIACTTPAPYPEALRTTEGGRFADAPAAAFGIGLDEARGHVWVTNTASNSVAVYAADDLRLIRQFPQGQVYHSREVLVDAASDRVFVTSSATAKVHVFDAETLEPRQIIEIDSSLRGENFYVMNMALDAAGGRLFVTSRATSELAVIDTQTAEVTQVFALPGAIHATGVAYDPDSGLVFVAGQGSDDLLLVDPDTGDVRHDVPVGAGALSVGFDAANGLAWVVNRGAGTITAVGRDGTIAANLDLGSYPNDVTATRDGTVYAVNKSFGAQDARGDLISVIRPRQD
ncbi:YncE family protein [Pseudooceanicola sediminis]|uniref:YncE family protein n=1 Tax=Pseudooceanicola sediminis TaxID=2211117 RepID=A0A399JCE7_9RHOB|nr:YncE family protein [Pseudooceanicola sediminis]KAA2315488.1 YncE family protein [Puniceibacterium sp. HSS470]RII40306.1 YncE family protein [Pseudooceanicola sediminis]|tara:strand:- start:120061 stop:121524 length:1464 start_codon:yes stop_codon:yes gene_type:complete